MKSKLNYLLLIMTTFIPFVAGCKAQDTAAADSLPAARVERGRYLVTVIGCNDCHTPLKITERGPEPDMTRMLSGHPSSLKMPARPSWIPAPGVGSVLQPIRRLPVRGE